MGDSAALEQVYSLRPDLQDAFPGDQRKAVGAAKKSGLQDLQDWARTYGYKEYSTLLSSYAPRQAALRPVPGVRAPVLQEGADFDFDSVTATSVFVADAASHRTLMSYRATVPHPLASISKLVTSMVVLDRKPSLAARYSVLASDEVGGARLSVSRRDLLTRLQLLNVTLIGSANNTANALARSTGLSKARFVQAMNAKASALGLKGTSFVDPTGIKVANTSTAEDVAAIGLTAFDYDDIRRATTTPLYTVTLARGTHTVKSTNLLLRDETNGLTILGGKTGYLVESNWNLVVKLQDARKEPIIVVVLGTSSQAQSFRDAEKVARWVWDHYDWSAS
ncbi:MAG: hypothetical protein RLZZ324_826 [Candidatus Parcubacteria bacterium]